MLLRAVSLCAFIMACGPSDPQNGDPSTGSGGDTNSGGALHTSDGGKATGGKGPNGGVGGAAGHAGSSVSAVGGAPVAAAGNGGSGGGSQPDSGMGVGDAALDTAVEPDAPAGYNPCPAEGTPCAIMPLGDSITLGLGAWTGYRGPFFSLALKDAKNMTYVGSLLDGPDTVDNVPFPKQHEGHSGYTIDGGGGRAGIKALIVDVMTEYRPNIIMMMIGTNDVQTHVTDIPTHFAGLVDLILSTDPKVLLVVAQVVPTGTDSNNLLVEDMNASIRTIVKDRADAGQHIITVDMYTPFVANPNYKTELLVDDLHPKFDGYVIMANTYYGVVGPLLR